jgi:hypothetical protein
MVNSTAWVRVSKALVLALFLLSSRTPLVASTSALGQDGKQPKPSKRGLPADTVRTTVSQSTERESDAPCLSTPASPSAWEGRPCAIPPGWVPKARTTAPEYLKPYTPSRTDTFLWPPL